MSEKLFPCKWCDAGDEPELLDEDGVKCSVSGKPGFWCHANSGEWWPCERKAAEEHAIAEAARDVLVIWDANEWAERAEGGELFEAIAHLRQTAEAAEQEASTE